MSKNVNASAIFFFCLLQAPTRLSASHTAYVLESIICTFVVVSCLYELNQVHQLVRSDISCSHIFRITQHTLVKLVSNSLLASWPPALITGEGKGEGLHHSLQPDYYLICTSAVEQTGPY